MKERITFVHGAKDAFEPSQLRLKKDTLDVSSMRAAREDKITVGVAELPQEARAASADQHFGLILWRTLKQCQDLRIRWTSCRPFAAVSPFNSRTSPGLHVYFTPQPNRSADLLCPMLKKIFGESLKCDDPKDTFTTVSTLLGMSNSSSSFQYYQVSPSLTDFITYIEQKICPSLGELCLEKASEIHSADYLDVDFDSASQTLAIRSFHHKPPVETWNQKISKAKEVESLEIGVLATELSTEPEKLSLGGFLTVLGEDEKPNPTRFSFPSRHHRRPASSESTFQTNFIPPTGLHPIMRLSFLDSSMKPPSESCTLNTYITLPSTLFPDKYQLSDPLFLASKNLHSLLAVSGETDLEGPNWAIKKWGSTLLLELAPPLSPNTKIPNPWTADIPLHLRYLAPSPGGIAHTDIPWPVVFWACESDAETDLSGNPFDRVHLGYDTLFGPHTIFHHLDPDVTGLNRSQGMIERLAVPVLDANRTQWLETGTMAVIVTGFLWVLWKLVSVVLQPEATGQIRVAKGKKLL